MLALLKQKALAGMRRAAEWRARSSMKANAELWKALQDYLRKTKSTGCNYTDYYHLYKLIRSLKPIEVLECGTGVSTLVIAFALMENDRAQGTEGRVTSMEEHEVWLEMSRSLLPHDLHRYVDFRLSPTVEDCFSLFRGVRYRDVPERNYDFVFVDGPKYVAPSDQAVTFDFDLLSVLRRSEQSVAALIDKRVSTCYVLQQILGRHRVRYSPVVHLGFVKPSTKHHLCDIDKETPSLSFASSFRLMTRTSLKLSRVDRSRSS